MVMAATAQLLSGGLISPGQLVQAANVGTSRKVISVPALIQSISVSTSESLSFSAKHHFFGAQQPRKVCQLGATPAISGRQVSVRAAAEDAVPTPSGRIITGPCFVVDDNIDTDQIIPAEYLTLVPSKPEEYEKLGSYAMAGLPKKFPRYIVDGQMKTTYPIMIGGANFGCGSSREHAPVAMGAAGCKAVVAESYARIFFRNCVATGELYPVESESRLCDQIKTGDEVTVDMEHDLLIHHPSGKQFSLKPIGEAGPVIDAGGIFNFARATGMIAAKAV